jgi:hypothetical protein
MTSATIPAARKIAEFATANINFNDATKLCKAIGPKMNEFQTSILAKMVCRFAAREGS